MHKMSRENESLEAKTPWGDNGKTAGIGGRWGLEVVRGQFTSGWPILRWARGVKGARCQFRGGQSAGERGVHGSGAKGLVAWEKAISQEGGSQGQWVPEACRRRGPGVTVEG
ncbi:hypothetical protein TIFTF001_016805 [Ficus carica]|uniref:Uncharacterized protein n=1 Tax=Ficus carica TaxID=3494 RepID=A0AA88APJ4_FICCA|nr:hypothetical protein TIFTF001_016805 [Ficus carica]